MTTSTAEIRPARYVGDGWPAYPLAAAAALYLAGWALTLWPMPWWALAAATAVVAAAAAGVGRAVLHWSTVGPRLCSEVTSLAVFAVLTAAAWLAVPAGDPVARAGWLLLWWAAFTAWWCALCLRIPHAVAAERGRPADPPAEVAPDGGPYEQILARAGLGDRVVVAAVRTVGAGLDVVTLTPRRGTKTLTFTQLQGALERIATEATLHWQDAGHDLEDGDVSVHPGRNMAEFVLHVARVRTLAGPDAVPMVVPDGPRSWCGPHTLGMYEDVVPLDVVFCDARTGGRHGEILGATGSGKGVTLNNIIGAVAGSDDAAVWLVGTAKLQKIAWGWLRPWLAGQSPAPVVDRVAGPRVRDALAGLADAYQYAVLCNDGVMGDDARRPERGRCALVVVIDEASDLLTRTKNRIRCHDGVDRNASEIVAAVRKVGRTGPVQMFTANQDNLFGSSGSAGSEGKRNSALAFVGKVRTAQDAAQLLAGLPARIDPTKLTDNQVLLDNGDEPRAVRAKMRALYGEDRIAEFAAACAGWQTGLIPEYAAVLEHYADRWNPLRHEALAAGCAQRGWTWPTSPVTLDQQTGTTTDPDRTAGPDCTEAPMTSADQPADRGPGTGPDHHARTDRTTGPHPDHPARTAPDRPAGPGPDQTGPDWSAADADWLAELGLTLDGPGSDAADGPGPSIPEVDTSGVRAAAEQVLSGHLARIAAAPDIPAPLSQAIGLASSPGAPEFIPTATIALAIGRITTSTDVDERNRRVAALGREIKAQAQDRGVKLESVSQSMGTDKATGKRVRPWGFTRDDLLAAARAWWEQAS